MDNLDDLIQSEGRLLITYLNSLVRARDNLRILFSTSVFLGGLESFVVKNLKNLNNKKARDLFIKKIPSEEAKA